MSARDFCGATEGRTVAMCVPRNSHKIRDKRFRCNLLQSLILHFGPRRLHQIAPNCKQVDESCRFCQRDFLHLFRKLEM